LQPARFSRPADFNSFCLVSSSDRSESTFQQAPSFKKGPPSGDLRELGLSKSIPASTHIRRHGRGKTRTMAPPAEPRKASSPPDPQAGQGRVQPEVPAAFCVKSPAAKPSPASLAVPLVLPSGAHTVAARRPRSTESLKFPSHFPVDRLFGRLCRCLRSARLFRGGRRN